MNNKDKSNEVGMDLIKSTNVLVEGLSNLLTSQSQGYQHILENVDRTEVYSREDLLDTTSQITHMLDSISNFEDTISQKLTMGSELLKLSKK